VQDYSIRWGDTLPPFAGPGSELPDEGYAIEAMADGTNFGNPQALIEVVKSLLTDGSLAVLEGWDNREAPIRLRISAPTAVAGPALADAEKALMAAVLATSKGPLVYVPPAQDSATCVFDVVAAKLERDTSDGWDLEEIRREYRFYLLTLTCLPFARTEESTVVPTLGIPVPPGSGTTVAIDDCSTTTGWTAPTGSGPTTTGTSVVVTSTYPRVPSLRRTGSVSMGATPYLKVQLSTVLYITTPTSPIGSNTPTFKIDGVTVSPLYFSGGFAYLDPGPSFTQLDISITPGTAWGSGVSAALSAIDISRTDQLPVSGTTRQQSRTASVLGSAPTQAAVRLYDATPGDLGVDTLVYTTKNANATPALRPWLDSAATVTSDSTMVSGARNTLTSPNVFQIPAANFTDGTYALMARLNVTTGGDLAWSARMVDATGATTLGSSVTSSGTITLGVSGGYRVNSLGAVSLPIVAVEADQMVEVTLTGTANMTLDEAWLFGLDDGALTWVRDTSLDLQWIEIRSPDLTSARPSVYGGSGAFGNAAVCIDFMCLSFGAHRFEPGLMVVHTITSSSLVSQSELEFYPRYHSHVEGSAA